MMMMMNTLARQISRSGRIRRTLVHVSKTTDAPPVPENPTQLVDKLIQYTRTLMRGGDHHLVAFSGGVDSSLVLALLKEASSSSSAKITPVLGVSPAVPLEQLELARRVAHSLGYALKEVSTTEGSDEMYIANNGQACLACKTHLYTHLQLVLKHIDNDSHDGVYLYNGTNADDVQDPTRLGLIAAANFQVKSPLLHASKEHVRQAAKHLGLENWNYAASPCLRSRLALGVQATSHHLDIIAKAERLIRSNLLGIKETANLRVRMLTKKRARIEVDPEFLKEAHGHLNDWSEQLTSNRFGFSSVDIRAFKSGSVATAVPIVETAAAAAS